MSNVDIFFFRMVAYFLLLLAVFPFQFFAKLKQQFQNLDKVQLQFIDFSFWWYEASMS